MIIHRPLATQDKKYLNEKIIHFLNHLITCQIFKELREQWKPDGGS